MLVFNPHNRISATDALKSSLFDEIRNPEWEGDSFPFVQSHIMCIEGPHIQKPISELIYE